jgi:hypothetical protein
MPLAQINIARMLAPLDSPTMHDFVNNLDRINQLADGHPGFIWRLKGEEDNAMAIRAFENDFLVINMSVWASMEDLHSYVYKTVHAEMIRRKKEWFSKMDEMHMALWWVNDGHLPSPAEARERLEYLRANGPTAFAFTFAKPFPHH